MAFFNWSNSYSVNVPQIDEQHKKLVGYLNELYESMQSGKSRDVLERILSDLVDYTKVHFAEEERFMSTFNYPLIANHKREHLNFVKQIEEFLFTYKNGSAAVSIKLGQFLKEWLKTHILENDKKLGAYLNENKMNAS